MIDKRERKGEKRGEASLHNEVGDDCRNQESIEDGELDDKEEEKIRLPQ